MRLTLASALVLIAMGTAAHADVLAGGPTYGGNSQARATCYVFNASSVNSLSITSAQIFNETSRTALQVGFSNCIGTLLPRGMCKMITGTDSVSAYTCKVVVGSKADTRGSLEISNIDKVVLNNVELR